ncbi:unnamed protein product, partial [Mesorhabditis spiculigera]
MSLDDSSSRPRHASLHQEDEWKHGHRRSREHARFPTDTTDEMFVRIQPWAEHTTASNGFVPQNTVSWRTEQAPTIPVPPPRKSALGRTIGNIRQRWNWRHYLALALVITLILALLTTAGILLAVLHKKHDVTPVNIYNSTLAPPPTTNYPNDGYGYVRGLQMRVFKVQDGIDSLSPVYESPGVFLGLSGSEIYYFDSNDQDNPRQTSSEIVRNGTDSCRVLSVDTECFHKNAPCRAANLIYCCSNGLDNYCSVANHSHLAHDAFLSTYRYSGVSALNFSTISLGNGTKHQANFERIEIRTDSASVDQGPIQCINFGKSITAAATAFRASTQKVDYLVAVSADGDLYISSQDDGGECGEEHDQLTLSLSNYLPAEPPISLAVDLVDDHVHIAVTFREKVYFLLYTSSAKLYILEGYYFSLIFPITIRGSFWANEIFYLCTTLEKLALQMEEERKTRVDVLATKEYLTEDEIRQKYFGPNVRKAAAMGIEEEEARQQKWCELSEMRLFEKVMEHKPAGPMRHFHMCMLYRYMNFIYEDENTDFEYYLTERDLKELHTRREVGGYQALHGVLVFKPKYSIRPSIEMIWEKLDELYDMDAIEKSELIPPMLTAQNDFFLPDGQFGELLAAKQALDKEDLIDGRRVEDFEVKLTEVKPDIGDEEEKANETVQTTPAPAKKTRKRKAPSTSAEKAETPLPAENSEQKPETSPGTPKDNRRSKERQQPAEQMVPMQLDEIRGNNQKPAPRDPTWPITNPCSKGTTANYICLASKDGHEFYLPLKCAEVSTTIKAMITGPGSVTEDGENNIIYFRDINAKTLLQVCRYFNYRYEFSRSISPEIPEFNIDADSAVDLLMASNFLDC